MNRFRDVILIIVAIGLLVAVLWPDGTSQQSDESSSTASVNDAAPKSRAPVASQPKSTQFQSLEGVFHTLFPLAEGTIWTYMVTDSSGQAPADTWRIRVVSAPEGEGSGVVEMGFGDALSRQTVYVADGGIQIQGLPFESTLRYPQSTGENYTGKWLPDMKFMISDAVWEYGHRRHIRYRSRGNNQEIIEEDALIAQTDRAQMLRQEKVIVPAGVFQADLVSWVSRIEIRAGKRGRRVLEKLTTEPFKKETVWFAPGVGMVRRRVTHAAPHQRDIIFELIRFEPPRAK